ncbi:hypothetical protein D3C78_1236710 [compost metagenome]
MIVFGYLEALKLFEQKLQSFTADTGVFVGFFQHALFGHRDAGQCSVSGGVDHADRAVETLCQIEPMPGIIQRHAEALHLQRDLRLHRQRGRIQTQHAGFRLFLPVRRTDKQCLLTWAEGHFHHRRR